MTPKNPDTGRVTMTYDRAGNLTSKVTATLRAQNAAIAYSYERNRLRSISYPLVPANNVTYTYGAPGASEYGAGRIVRVTDATGDVTRGYGPLGELTRETRTIYPYRSHPPGYFAVGPLEKSTFAVNVSGETLTNTTTTTDTTDTTEETAQPSDETRALRFTTHYRYDTWGRLRELTYPDDEVVRYQYDAGGNVASVTGDKGAGVVYPYVTSVLYDKFEQRTQLTTGNGITTRYSYDAATRRLATLSADHPGRAFQDVSYSYDAVGNILGIVNDPSPSETELGGASTQSFRYDDLYRLTHAEGRYARSCRKANADPDCVVDNGHLDGFDRKTTAGGGSYLTTHGTRRPSSPLMRGKTT